MTNFENRIAEFDSVALNQTGEVKLMNRIDRKYWFHISKLNQVLKNALANYNILEINGRRLMKYQTMYFDTPENSMYLKHHNRNLGRHKIRTRKYDLTGDVFLEIKFKNNKKITQKHRILIDDENKKFTSRENEFILKNSFYSPTDLHEVVANQFLRITLVHKNFTDRCTIDISPEFRNESKSLKLNDLVILEIKRGSSLQHSPMTSILQNLKIRQRGLSKYCTSRALLEPGLKQNIFKARLRFIGQQILN